jgi:hypothetical protein
MYVSEKMKTIWTKEENNIALSFLRVELYVTMDLNKPVFNLICHN